MPELGEGEEPGLCAGGGHVVTRVTPVRSKPPTASRRSMLRRAESPLTPSSPHLLILIFQGEATGLKPAQLLYWGALAFGTMPGQRGSKAALHHPSFRSVPRLSDVAKELGFSEISAFTRAFRRWSGETPSSWKLRHQRRGQNVPAMREHYGRVLEDREQAGDDAVDRKLI